MWPGALDVLPLKVHFSVLPLLPIEHVSVSVGPVTPKLAVAAVGLVTESEAEADAPPYVPVTVATIVPFTALVVTPNVALLEPAGTVTLAGTVTGSAAASTTTAPPAGAAAVRATVPETEFPPTTLALVNEISETAIRTTVNIGDWLLLPFRVAVTVAVPAATPVIVNAAVDEPAGTATDAGTVATAALLVVSVTLTAVAAVAESVMVPCPAPLSAIVDALSVTVETVGPVMAGGDADVLAPPQPIAKFAAASVSAPISSLVR